MIVVKNLNKVLGNKQVLKDISFHISPSECVAVLGKNGAGKTTLLNVVSGILKPDSGYVRLNRCENPLKDYETLKKLSCVSGVRPQLDRDMKLIYSFDNCAGMYGLKKQEYVQRLKRLADKFGIYDCLDRMVYQLSLGQKMKGELVYALLSEPEILFLDEALIGLDVSVKEEVLEYIYDIKEEGKTTIIYTSHTLSEVERLCDRIILLDEGRVIFDGSIETIMNEFSPGYRIDFEISGGLPDMEDLPVERYVFHNHSFSVVFQKQKISSAEIIHHVMQQCTIHNIKMEEPGIEDTIKKVLEVLERHGDYYD